MTAEIAWAVGLVLCLEGLILSLLPGRLESLLKLLSDMPVEARRLAGLAALGAGVALLWAARAFGT